MSIVTQNRSKVTVADPAGLCAGDWVRHSGVGGSLTSTKVRAVAGGPKVVLSGEYEAADITTVRYVDPDRDAGLLDALQNNAAVLTGVTVSVISIDKDGQAVGQPQTFAGCAVGSWSLSDGDANADQPLELSITWTVGSK